jgi:hypothetical protein
MYVLLAAPVTRNNSDKTCCLIQRPASLTEVLMLIDARVIELHKSVPIKPKPDFLVISLC